MGGGGQSAFEDNAIITEKPTSESLPSLRIGAWIRSQQQPDLLTLLGLWMGAAGPFTALPYCCCCWLASPFPLRDLNRIDPLSLMQALQTPSLRLQPCPSTSYLLQARASGLPLCLLSLPAWSAQEGCGPWQRYTRTAQLITSHLLLNAFTFVSSTMTSIIPPKYDCV